eukprot:COSAG06_NODE_1996_length_7886_cov_6.036985_13_plen_214_part_00
MERAQRGRARQSRHKLEARTQRCIKVRGTSLYRRRDRRPHWPRPAHGRSLEAELHTVGLRKKESCASPLGGSSDAWPLAAAPNTVFPLRGNTGMVNLPAEGHSAESCLSNLSLAREGPTGRVPPLSSRGVCLTRPSGNSNAITKCMSTRSSRRRCRARHTRRPAPRPPWRLSAHAARHPHRSRSCQLAGRESIRRKRRRSARVASTPNLRRCP